VGGLETARSAGRAGRGGYRGDTNRFRDARGTVI